MLKPLERKSAENSRYRVKVRLVRQPLVPSTPSPLPEKNETQPELLPSGDTSERLPLAQEPDSIEGIDIGIEPIGEIDLKRTADAQSDEVPPDHASLVFDGKTRHWSASEIDWPLPATPALSGEFCYRPLYFEEANLERYGNRRGCIQPAWSAVRFFATVPALPYLAAADPPDVCRYERYPYQAGRSAPRVKEMPPLSIRGGLVEAGTAVGLIFLIP